MSHSILISSTPRPLLGEIVEIPDHIPCPTRDDRYTVDHPILGAVTLGKVVRFSVGRVVEVGQNLIAVTFFGYPNSWDYSAREAGQFTIAAALPSSL